MLSFLCSRITLAKTLSVFSEIQQTKEFSESWTIQLWNMTGIIHKTALDGVIRCLLLYTEGCSSIICNILYIQITLLLKLENLCDILLTIDTGINDQKYAAGLHSDGLSYTVCVDGYYLTVWCISHFQSCQYMVLLVYCATWKCYIPFCQDHRA